MNSNPFDVIVIGGGAAGLTAAIGLARADFSVVVVEAAPFPGAENWSGCVYFTENLAHPDILGPDGVESLAWERRLIERGLFATDGHGLLGMTYRDPQAFQNCYTVLRPIYDHHLSMMAERLGVVTLNATTVESLIRSEDRVIGVSTNRGPLYANLVYLAEGDASHLVTKEGYERFTNPRQSPKFLQGIKQVLEFAPGVLEDRFGISSEEGVAYEMLLRNGMLKGKRLRLNAGGFLYTNKNSLSVGLVLPADNLHNGFDGDPNLLMDWFAELPSLQPWFKDAKRSTFGAKIIRGGGAREIPTLIDNGLAIGGAASAVGIDFPYPNFTGPATKMGLLIALAASRIRAEGGDFTRDNLRRYYLEPLQSTHYWQDVEFLRRWPGYVAKTKVFFGRNVDLSLQSAYLWTRSNQGVFKRWYNWLSLMLRNSSRATRTELSEDSRELGQALRFQEVFPRLTLWRLLLDGSVNTLRDVFRRPRANLLEAGEVKLHYKVAGGNEPSGMPPVSIRYWFRRFAPVLASTAKLVYSNNDTPLSKKLPRAVDLLLRQVNLLDVFAAGFIGLASGLTSTVLLAWDRFFTRRKEAPPPPISERPVSDLLPEYSSAARKALDLTQHLSESARNWDAKLAGLEYQTSDTSHIHLLWPGLLQEKNNILNAGIWHVCPAHVYEARTTATGQLQMVVNYENCIKCETCWRTSDDVDWARDGEQMFVYATHSPSVTKLLQPVDRSASPKPIRFDYWDSLSAEDSTTGSDYFSAQEAEEFLGLCTNLTNKLQEFDEALAREPRTVDFARGEHLTMLARYGQQVAIRMSEMVRVVQARCNSNEYSNGWKRFASLVEEVARRSEERTRHARDRKFSWAAADGRLLRFHHLPGIQSLLKTFTSEEASASGSRLDHWLQSEQAHLNFRNDFPSRLDEVFPKNLWRDAEQQQPLTSEQEETLFDILQTIPSPTTASLHPHVRKQLLAYLGRLDPSLAFRVASHLWARDAVTLSQSADEKGFPDRQWACLILRNEASNNGQLSEEVLFIPAKQSNTLVILEADQLTTIHTRQDMTGQSIQTEPIRTLGLRGAGLCRVTFADQPVSESGIKIDRPQLIRSLNILRCADLTAIALGMAEVLQQRALEQATSRVQFPGLFHDEDSRDTIGKFGAIKKMVAEIAARRFLIETLLYDLSPDDFSEDTENRTMLVKALTAEVLGTAPGSVAYNAGQVFGGTGYSEDDILSKYYRDAAAWRFLGPDNSTIYLQQGLHLQTNGEEDATGRLSCFPEESALFDQVVQRKALQAELDEIRVHRARVRTLVNEWGTFFRSDGDLQHLKADTLARREAEFADSLGRQDSFLLASKALLLRVHSRMEKGMPSEVEVALLRVWLEAAADSLSGFEATVKRHIERTIYQEDRPVVDPSLGPPETEYADVLNSPDGYNSGDFLVQPVRPARPRYVPELVETDATLANQDRELRIAFEKHFGPLRDGLNYERYIESHHRPSQEDLEYCRQHGYFRMPIAGEFGGEGATKAHYYLLTTRANRQADVALSLTIQVNSSLGTTPVLMAYSKDLPKAAKDVEAFRQNTALQEKVRNALLDAVAIVQKEEEPDVQNTLKIVGTKYKEGIGRSPALKVLFHAFEQSQRDLALAQKAFDQPATLSALKAMSQFWQEACANAEEYHQELEKRKEACELFFRWVSSGQISAFALTEPSAGSDTARVATRARLRSVPVTAQPDGTFTFTPDNGKESRTLLDANRLEFVNQQNNGFRDYVATYRYADDAEPVPIKFTLYDYETDDDKSVRHITIDNKTVPFTDVAQLRERDGQLWYDYWELTGAKMWITNGRMCGILCLYAKTEEGVTGFIVDRHAEGLVVGKDEAKMGQCGSPTNELTLQAVRVPRENVIGLEGRGQVNALETLNVGGAGLAMSAMSQMNSLLDAARQVASQHVECPSWMAWRLRQMEEDQFIAEALAFNIIGYFEHKKTKSVRLESAIAKMMVSELFHRMIETAEGILGIAGQTHEFLVEKRKRDARVLNIYEGTNEIQRFFILRDLFSDICPRWQQATSAPSGGYQGRETLAVEHLKTCIRERSLATAETFGSDMWQNPNLQANCFLLSEAVAWLAAADSTLGRLAWISRQDMAEDEPSSALDLGKRAFTRCVVEVRHRLKRFDEEFTHLRRGYYAPEIRAASLLFREMNQPETKPIPTSAITEPLSILLILDTPIPGVPEPVVTNGQIREPYLTLTKADQSALEMALRLKDANPENCRIHVILVGSSACAGVLRDCLSLGVDSVRLIDTPQPVPTDRAAAALSQVVSSEAKTSLVLAGVGSEGSESGLLPVLVAEALAIPVKGTCERISLVSDNDNVTITLQSEDVRKERSLPACVLIRETLALRKFTTIGFVKGWEHQVEVVAWPNSVSVNPKTCRVQTRTPPTHGALTSSATLLPLEAGHLVLTTLGKGGHQDSQPRQTRSISMSDVNQPHFFSDSSQTPALAILATDANGKLRSSAANVLAAVSLVSAIKQIPFEVLVFAPDEKATSAAMGLSALVRCRVTVVPLTESFSDDLLSGLLPQVFADHWLSLPTLVGEPWAQYSLAAMAAKHPDRSRIWSSVLELEQTSSGLRIATPMVGVTVRGIEEVSTEDVCPWIVTVSEETQIEECSLPEQGEFVAERWQPKLADFYRQQDIRRLIDELKEETGLVRLTDAEFIIDVGYGVGNQDGFEAVIVPLEECLRELGVPKLMTGGSRKVTEELHLLPEDRQIGQSGVSVRPKVLLAIGISGAPQHLNYISPNTIIVAFNRDPDAPIMVHNQRQPQPKVYPVLGDLFETVPAFRKGLLSDQPTEPMRTPRRHDVTRSV